MSQTRPGQARTFWGLDHWTRRASNGSRMRPCNYKLKNHIEIKPLLWFFISSPISQSVRNQNQACSIRSSIFSKFHTTFSVFYFTGYLKKMSIPSLLTNSLLRTLVPMILWVFGFFVWFWNMNFSLLMENSSELRREGLWIEEFSEIREEEETTVQVRLYMSCSHFLYIIRRESC